MAQKLSDQLYQLKITLRYSNPTIWRRLIVPATISLYKLHQGIQVAMGWTDSHLHQFVINGREYGDSSILEDDDVLNERRYKLKNVVPRKGLKFFYEYDFGDGWRHNIVVEEILPNHSGTKYMICLDGQLACPPEDVGGIPGYEEFLEAINDPEHEEHESYLEWIGADFDPEEFNIDQVNRIFSRMR